MFHPRHNRPFSWEISPRRCWASSNLPRRQRSTRSHWGSCRRDSLSKQTGRLNLAAEWLPCKKKQNNCLGVQFQWTHTYIIYIYIYIIITILMGPISQLVGVFAIVTVMILPINNLSFAPSSCRRLLSRSCWRCLWSWERHGSKGPFLGLRFSCQKQNHESLVMSTPDLAKPWFIWGVLLQ